LALSISREIPTAHLDGKKGQDISEITRYFKFQVSSNSCYTTCIFNVLKDLAASHDCPAIGFSEQKVNKLCGYREPFGPKPSLVVPNLNGALRGLGYVVREQLPARYDRLVKILADTESSYPLIGLAYQYLVDRDAAEDLGIPSPPDHTVIVLSCNPTETIIFDPFDARSRAMQKSSDRIGRGLYLIATTQMTDYWVRAIFSSWAFWVHRESEESAKNMRLERYSMRREVE
jgi:hypothetical protein